MPPKAAPVRPKPPQQRRRTLVTQGRIASLGSPVPFARSPTPTALPVGLRAAKQCPACKSSNFVEEDGRVICADCGNVITELDPYTAEQGFEESNGRIQAMGQRIAEGQTHARTFAPRTQPGFQVGYEAAPNREKADREAKQYMQRYAQLLGISDADVMKGLGYFGIAYSNSFVRGRTVESVAAVSLYLACRRSRHQAQGKMVPNYDLMLIDFAEHMDMNVFALGQMYLDLVRKLFLLPEGKLDPNVSQDLGAMGPEVLIDKFVRRLDFGPGELKVKNDAIRIVSRMKRDWMAIGRRPSGVCGAAVILAARMNNYRRTTREVVLVAKVTEITINKRLEEFAETDSSKLSVNDYRNSQVLDAIQAHDPPAFYRANNPPPPKRKRGRPRKYPLPESAAEIEDDQSTADGGDPTTATAQTKRARIDAEGFAVPALPSHVQQSQIDPALSAPSSASQHDRNASNTTTVPADGARLDLDDSNSPAVRKAGRPPGAKNWRAPPPTAAELAIEAELEHDVLEALQNNPDLDETNIRNELRASNPETFLVQTQPAADNTPSATSSAPAGPDPKGPAVNTSDGNTGYVSSSPTLKADEFDDDPEIAICLLNDEEKEFKEAVWVTENADWLRQDHAKRIKRELKEAEMREKGIDPSKDAQKGPRRRKDGTRRAGRAGDVSYLDDLDRSKKQRGHDGDGTDQRQRERSASEAVSQMLKIRAAPYSRRINYDRLEEIYQLPGSSESRSRSQSELRGQPDDREGSVMSSSSILNAVFNPKEPRGSQKRSKQSLAAERRERSKKQKRQQRQKSGTAEPEDVSGASSQSGSPSATEEERATNAALHQQLMGGALPTPDPTQQSPFPGREEMVGPVDSLPESPAAPLLSAQGQGLVDAGDEDAESSEGDYVEDEDEEDEDDDVQAAFDGTYGGRE